MTARRRTRNRGFPILERQVAADERLSLDARHAGAGRPAQGQAKRAIIESETALFSMRSAAA